MNEVARGIARFPMDLRDGFSQLCSALSCLIKGHDWCGYREQHHLPGGYDAELTWRKTYRVCRRCGERQEVTPAHSGTKTKRLPQRTAPEVSA